MAKIKVGEKSGEVADGSAIHETTEKLGIPFSCSEGVCGTCLVKVNSGAENLNDLNEQEKEFGLSDKNSRLCCQAKINSGEVDLESAY